MIKKNIQALLNSNVTAYRISKDTGIPESTLSRLKSGKDEIGQMTLDNALKLDEYYANINKKPSQ